MQANNLLLFVYGTLRRDCPSGAHSRYLQGASFIAPAKTRGHLFLIDYYPGFCPTANTQHPQSTSVERDLWVQGEVYLLKNEVQLQQLDSYEGCASDSPEPQEYTRRLIDVSLASGERLKVWTYIYTGDPSAFATIASGDFLQR